MCGAFILYSFVSFDRLYALKIKYPMIVSFSHTYLQATMCKIQHLYCIIVIRAWFRLACSLS